MNAEGLISEKTIRLTKTTLRKHHMKNTSLKSKISAGFSLVELLVVIAVIGVIAAIAIPNIGNITGSASEATQKRNAQNLASVYSAALAAGAVDATTLSGNKQAKITKLTDDGFTGTGIFAGQTFIVKMEAAEATSAATHLDDNMNYDPQ